MIFARLASIIILFETTIIVFETEIWYKVILDIWTFINLSLLILEKLWMEVFVLIAALCLLCKLLIFDPGL